MKSFSVKEKCKKIIIAFLTFVLLFQFMLPIRSEADFLDDIVGGDKEEFAHSVFSGMAQILAAGGDLVMGAFNNFLLGTKGFGTAMVTSESLGKGSWFDPVDDDGNAVTSNPPDEIDEMSVVNDDSGKIFVYVEDETLDEHALFAGSDTWEVPNLLYCPENIFGNNIAMLDVNFLNPNQYSSVIGSNKDENGNELSRGIDTAEEKNGADSSIANQLKSTIAGWYKAFRNIAVVTLLSVLVFLGIRILISSTAEDKAKYKEIIKDWVIALVLVFVVHFIMSFAIMIVNQINSLFINANNNVFVSYGSQVFKSNFTGVIRFLAQSKDGWNAWAYTIIYIVLVAYTVSFTYQYLRRVLYIAFYTMIAPLVAITYPLDKLGDGRSQAFNKWLKEYIMTMALQPIHLIVYTMIVSSSLTLAIKSPLYALVAIGFLIPAEQFIKSLFGVESKADGGFAAGAATTALAMNALGSLKKQIAPPHKGGKGGSTNDDSDDNAPKIRQSGDKVLQSFNSGAKQEDNKGNEDVDTNESFEFTGNNLDYMNTYGGDDELPEGEEGYNMDFAPSSEYMIDEPQGQGAESQYELSGDDMDTVSMYGGNEELPDAGYGIDFAPSSDYTVDEEPEEQNGEVEYSGNDNSMEMYGDEELPEGEEGYNIDFAPSLERGVEEPEQAGNAQDEEAIRKADEAEKLQKEKERKRLQKSISKKYRGRMWRAAGLPSIKDIAKGAAKGVVKGALRGAGGMIGAGAGLAIGIATGKGVQGAMQGLGIGAAAGLAVGNNAYNLGERAVRYGVDTVNKERELLREQEIEKREATQGVDEANQYARNNIGKADKKRYKEMLRDYYHETGGQDLTAGKTHEEVEELYKQIYDYESHGVSNKDDIIKGLQLEHDQKYAKLRKDAGLDGSEQSHNNVVDIMRMKQKYGAEYIHNTKKREEFNSVVDARVKDANAKERVKDLFWEANGVDHTLREDRKVTTTKAQTTKNATAKSQTQRTKNKTTKKTPSRPANNTTTGAGDSTDTPPTE